MQILVREPYKETCDCGGKAVGSIHARNDKELLILDNTGLCSICLVRAFRDFVNVSLGAFVGV